MGRPQSFDRWVGHAIRARVAAVPGGTRVGRLAGDALAPAFQGLVAAMLTRPALRRNGTEALAAGVLAAGAARVARDRIARPRPGVRPEGGLPSRHAAAAVAITQVVSRRHPRLRPWLVLAAAAGLIGRVVTGDHDPADIAAGAAVGWASDFVIKRATSGAR